MKGVLLLTKIVHKRVRYIKGLGFRAEPPYINFVEYPRAFVKCLFHSSVEFYYSKIWPYYSSFNIAEVQLHY